MCFLCYSHRLSRVRCSEVETADLNSSNTHLIAAPVDCNFSEMDPSFTHIQFPLLGLPSVPLFIRSSFVASSVDGEGVSSRRGLTIRCTCTGTTRARARVGHFLSVRGPAIFGSIVLRGPRIPPEERLLPTRKVACLLPRCGRVVPPRPHCDLTNARSSCNPSCLLFQICSFLRFFGETSAFSEFSNTSDGSAVFLGPPKSAEPSGISPSLDP